MRKILTLSVALISLNNIFSQKQTLQLNLTKNQSYIQHLISNMTIVQTVGGQEMNIDMIITSKTIFKVLEVKGQTYDMDVKYDNISMKMTMPGQPTNEKLDEMMNKMTNAMKGKSFGISITKDGKVTDVKNMDAVFSGLFDSLDQITPAQKEQFQQQMKDAYGDKTFKANFEMATAIFPNHDVGKGDTWTIKSKMETTYKSNTETLYTLKDITSKYYIITAASTIAMDNNDSFKMTNGMPIKINLNGNSVSDIKVDKITGWIFEAKLIQDMNGNTEIQDCPQLPGGMKIPMKMKNIMTITQ